MQQRLIFKTTRKLIYPLTVFFGGNLSEFRRNFTITCEPFILLTYQLSGPHDLSKAQVD